MHIVLLFTRLDLCVSSLRRCHANIFCTVASLTDDPRRESNECASSCLVLWIASPGLDGNDRHRGTAYASPAAHAGADGARDRIVRTTAYHASRHLPKESALWTGWEASRCTPCSAASRALLSAAFGRRVGCWKPPRHPRDPLEPLGPPPAARRCDPS